MEQPSAECGPKNVIQTWALPSEACPFNPGTTKVDSEKTICGESSQIQGDKIGSEAAVVGLQAITTQKFLFYRAIKAMFISKD